MLVWIFMNIFFIDTSAPSIKILSLFVGRDLFWRSNGFATAYKRSYRNYVCHVESSLFFFENPCRSSFDQKLWQRKLWIQMQECFKARCVKRKKKKWRQLWIARKNLCTIHIWIVQKYIFLYSSKPPKKEKKKKRKRKWLTYQFSDLNFLLDLVKKRLT